MLRCVLEPLRVAVRAFLKILVEGRTLGDNIDPTAGKAAVRATITKPVQHRHYFVKTVGILPDAATKPLQIASSAAKAVGFVQKMKVEK